MPFAKGKAGVEASGKPLLDGEDDITASIRTSPDCLLRLVD